MGTTAGTSPLMSASSPLSGASGEQLIAVARRVAARRGCRLTVYALGNDAEGGMVVPSRQPGA